LFSYFGGGTRKANLYFNPNSACADWAGFWSEFMGQSSPRYFYLSTSFQGLADYRGIEIGPLFDWSFASHNTWKKTM
jgi:hypothetical protein